MTQALNLANFANTLNTTGQTSNSGLQNPSVIVNTGAGLSGGGAVALGSALNLSNSGVISVSAGSGISVSSSTGDVTITNTAVGVTSFVGQTGAINVSNPYSIGSMVMGRPANLTTYNPGDAISGSILYALSGSTRYNSVGSVFQDNQGNTLPSVLVNVGSWRCVSPAYQQTGGANLAYVGLWVRYA